MKNKKALNFATLTQFALASIAIFLGGQASAMSTRVGNVVECRQEDNNGNGLYIKREGCYQAYTSGYEHTMCLFKAYFTAEGGKGNKSVIQSLRENSAFVSNADKFTNINVDDYTQVRFRGFTYISRTSSEFDLHPVDNNGHFSLFVRSNTSTSSNDFMRTDFNYTYNCSYVP